MAKSSLRICVLSTFLACVGAAGAEPVPFQPEPASKTGLVTPPPPLATAAQLDPAIVESTLELLHLTQCDLLILPVDFTPGLPLSVGLPIGGEIINLDLRPYSIRSDRFQVLEQREDGQLHQVKPPVENTLRGEIRGEEGSIIAGGVMPDGLAARIIRADGSELWIEPVSSRIAGAPAGLHAVYTRGDLFLDQPWRCGGPELDEHNPDDVVAQPQEMEPGLRGATRWHAIMDADADFEYYSVYGGTSIIVSRIGLITNTMNLQYERDVNITHDLGTVIIRTTSADPYTSTDPAVLNAQIETEWSSANRPGTSDVVQLFTARDIDSNTIGRANHIGSICLDGDSNCLSQSDFNNNFMSATDLSAHELGHLWDAVHCTCSNPESTMNPSITSINRFTLSNDQDNIGQINAYRATRGCLTTTSPGTAASNNDCSNSITIGTGTFGFSNNNATTDGPEPTTCGSGNNIAEDVWYRFVPPCDGNLTVTTCTTGFDTVVAFYTGSCGSLTQVGCNDDSVCGGVNTLQSTLTESVSWNVPILVRVGGYNGANGSGVLNVSFTSCPVPPNNNCASATLIDHCGTVSFSTIGATTDGPNEATDCNNASYQHIGSDIWYRYIAPCTGTVRVSLCGSLFDTKLAVYTSCPAGPNLTLACNDDFCGLDSQVEFTAIGGADYFFRIGGYFDTEGTGVMQVTNLACQPVNDVCAGAIAVSTGATAFSTVGACSDGFTSPLCSNDGGNIPRDIWFMWTSPSCVGLTTFDTCANGFDTKIAVYDSCPIGNNTAIVCNDDACGGNGLGSRVAFTPLPSTTYYIRIGGFANQTGTGTLNIAVAAAPAPSNDACASATVVTGGNSYLATLCGATNDGTANCGSSATNPDIWFSYAATCSGTVTFTTCGSHDTLLGQDAGVDTVLSAYSGTCGGLSQLACNDDSAGCANDTNIIRDSSITINVVQGQTYRIRLSKFSGHPVLSTVRLNVGTCTGQFCDADWCQDGEVGVPDIFCFLSDWFANDPVARNYGGTNGVPAIFAFLSIWFATGQGPCP